MQNNRINWTRIIIFILLLTFAFCLFSYTESPQSILNVFLRIFFFYITYALTIMFGTIGLGIGLTVEMFLLYLLAALIEKLFRIIKKYAK